MIRPARREDVPAIVALVREVLAEFGIAFGVGAKTDTELLELPDSYTARGGAFWVAVHPETHAIVGTAGIAPVAEGDVELRKMYLLPAARGRGLGRALLQVCLDHARASGARRVVLDTVHEMKAAIALYERAGFKRDDAQIRASRCSRGYALELRGPSP